MSAGSTSLRTITPLESVVSRRDFIGSAAAASYSLFVRLDDEPPHPGHAIPPQVPQTAAGVPDARFDGEPNMELVDLSCDLLVAGGGMSGVCAALAAARAGAHVILVQDRSRLGGNSSSEVKMHIVGANMHRGRPGWREGGLIEELRLDDAVNNQERCWELWDLLLYDKLASEPNCTLLLDTTIFAADVVDGRIRRVMARCDKTETLFRVEAPLFADCTGDSRLALEAGASIMWGHEDRSAFNEPLAWEKAGSETLGSSILFTARNAGRPVSYKPPSWARKIEERHLQYRPINSWEYGFWWIEWGGHLDTIRDNERIRFELLAIVTGVWDHIKNSGKFPDAETWALDWVGMMPGKRESRRIVGDYILTQHDLMGRRPPLDDAIAIGGWGLDEHPPGGFDDSDSRPFVSIPLQEVYNIPLRSLYSRDVANLFMAGRNASCSHVAFTSTRVMATCSVMGQAAGTAAAICAERSITPAELYVDKPLLGRLQQTLLRNDQTIKGLRNEDPDDLARDAIVTASHTSRNSRPDHVINGLVRDMYEQYRNRWAARLTPHDTWIRLDWTEYRTISSIQLTFDTGFHRELTLTASDSHNQHMIRAPQPETVRSYSVEALVGESWEILTSIADNHQRLRLHEFDPIQTSAVRLNVLETNGSDYAIVYEIRCYA